MSKFKSKPNNGTGPSGKPEILFDRPTKQRPPHEVLRYGITEAILDGKTALFEVLPGVGKSRSITKAANGLKMPVTILTNLTENYDQYEDWGNDDGVRVHKLPKSDLCPTLQGDYPNDTIAQKAQEAYNKGWPVSTIHREFNLPCERGKNTCTYREKTNEIDTDSPDSFVGHYTQGYNPPYVNNRVVVIDEDAFDHYITEIKNPVEKADEYLDTLDEVPFNSIPYKPDDEEIKQALKILKNEGLDAADHQDLVGEFHAKAPLTAYALLAAKKMKNNWWVADLPGNRTAAFYDKPGRGSLHLFNPPDLSGAEAVIGLDATPCLSKWEAIIGDDFEYCRLFNDSQRNQYLREQGYEFIQLNDYVWPVSSGNVSIRKCEAYLREIKRKERQLPDLITSKQLLEKLKNTGLEDLWDDELYYGDLRGKNDLADSELLVVLGSPSRSDSDIQWKAALHGECAKPATNADGERLSGYQLDFQNEVANDMLETIRRDGTFQAAMRAGRSDETEATIYIATGMVPDWLETEKVGQILPNGAFDACPNLRSKGERQVIEALRGARDMAPSELYEQVEISKDRAKKHRQSLQRKGFIEKNGERRWAKYSDSGLDELNIAGAVYLGLSVCPPYKNHNRGNTPIESRPKPVMPRQEPPADPTRRYPDWMRDIQQKVRQRSFSEQEQRTNR